MNNYDLILKAFKFQYGEGKAALDNPRPDGDYYYASDSRVLVRIKKDLCDGEYQPHEKQPNFERVIPPKHISLELPVFNILEQIMSHNQEIKLIGKEAVCDECNGSREVTWTYEDMDGYEHDKEFDCPICDGLGYVQEKTVPIEKLNMSINGVSFNIGLMKKVLNSIQSLLGLKTAKIVHLSQRGPMLIEAQPGVDMLIMSDRSEHQIINVHI